MNNNILKLECIYKTTSGMFDKDVYLKPYAAFDLTQSIAGRHAEDMHVGAYELLKQNLGWLIARQTIIFHDNPLLFDELKMVTFPYPKKNFEFLREYGCYNKDNKLIFSGVSLWVIYDFSTGKLVNKDIYPDGTFVENKIFDKVKKPLNIKKNDNIIYKYQVKLGDLDMYNHLNNAMYVRIIFDALNIPASSYQELTISYLKQAKLNDIIYIYQEIINNEINISGYINDDICFSANIIRKE